MLFLENLYAKLKDKVEFRFNCHVDDVEAIDGGYRVITEDGVDECEKCIVSVGRSGSKWMEKVCEDLRYHDKIQPCRYRSPCGTSGSYFLTSNR